MAKNKSPHQREKDRHVEAVIRALEILNCFEQNSALRIKDIVRITGLNKSRIIRLCGTLVHMGYLNRFEESYEFKLGPKLLMLGKAFERRSSFIAYGRPLLEKLVEETKESASIFIIDGLKRLCIVKKEGEQPIRYIIKEGEHSELHLGSSGKVLLAFSSDGIKKQIFDAISSGKTKLTVIKNLKQFKSELKAIQQKGFAESEGEKVQDVYSISMPIYNHNGEVDAAMTVAGPSFRFTSTQKRKAKNILRLYAEQMSFQRGYQKH